MKTDLSILVAEFSRVESRSEFGSIPLERVLAQHWPRIAGCRDSGWTWKQIAAALTRAGLRLKGNKPISEKYLSAVAARIAGKSAKQPLPNRPEPQSIPPTATGRMAQNASPHARAANSTKNNGSPPPVSAASAAEKRKVLQDIRTRMTRARAIRDE